MQPDLFIEYHNDQKLYAEIKYREDLKKDWEKLKQFSGIGEIQIGGFKIWNILNKSNERNVKLYRMPPDDYRFSKKLKDLSKAEKDQLTKIPGINIKELVDKVVSVGKKYEQELWQDQGKHQFRKAGYTQKTRKKAQ